MNEKKERVRERSEWVRNRGEGNMLDRVRECDRAEDGKGRG
jgi:hypothetical protein